MRPAIGMWFFLILIIIQYGKASILTCEPLTVTGNQTRTTCSAAQVYSSARCEFGLYERYIPTFQTVKETQYITYNHTSRQPGGNGNNVTSCTLQYPLDKLSPGVWSANVTMFTNQAGAANSYELPNTLKLSFPDVDIDHTNCPKAISGGDTNVRNGYIRQGETASCKCTRTDEGNPPGTIGWTSFNEGSFGILSESEDSVTIQINATDTFTCRSASVFKGLGQFRTYESKFAYGPSSASLTFNPPGPIYLCPDQQTEIDVTCQVPANSFNPALLFTMTKENTTNLVTKAAGDNAQSKTFKYNFTASGQHTFTCRVENTIFSDMFTDAPTSAIEVYAPPASSPSFQVTGSSVISDDSETWVKQGSDISVSCSAGEAYPLVQSVNVTCELETSSTGQLSVLNVSVDELACQCVVDHETNASCNGHNLDNEIIIQTAYGPIEVNMGLADNQLIEVPNQPLNLCSSEGLDLTVFCAVKLSEVRPGMLVKDFTLTKPHEFSIKQNYLLRLNESDVYKFVTKLIIKNGGNHNLVCEARNPKFSDVKQTQSVTIEVRESPKDPPKISAHSGQHDDVLMEGDDVTVTCNISGGYPSIQSVTLTCGQNKSVTSIGTTAELTLNKIGQTLPAISCTCQGAHVSGCYNLISVLPLTISPKTNEEKGSFSLAVVIGTAIGSIVGTLVLVAAMCAIVYFIKRKNAEPDDRNLDREYEIPPPRTTPVPNEYGKINYTTPKSVSESSKQKAESIYQNQAYDDDKETSEPDLDTYEDL